MLRNYLKIAWRNLMKNKRFSLINIAGLSLGMAACLIILQYVSFELSFDQFNKNAKDIYRVWNDRYQNGKLIQHGTITYSGIGKAMQDDYPEVIDHVRVMPYGAVIIRNTEKKIGDQEVLAADNSFLHMFSYPIVAGDAETGLQQPYEAILSESAAEKMFNVRDKDYSAVVGQTVMMGSDSVPYKITAVCKNVPENSHLQFDALVSYSTIYAGSNPNPYADADYNFTSSDFWHYIQLKPGTDYKTLQAKLPAFSERHFQGNKISGSDEKFFLQPLSKAHLYSDFEYEIGRTANATTVWGLLVIAILIIIIAWVNYINLATAKSMERAREVGVRKVSGATKHQLIRQFLTESFLINVIALLAAFLIVLLVQKGFNNLLGHQLSLSYLFAKGLNGYSIMISLILLLIFGIFVSGFYPAFVLSSFKPILVLKGKYVSSAKGIFLRKTLVVGQFAITVTLIIGSLVVYRQIRFVNSQNLGMNISQVLVLRPPELTPADSTFRYKVNSLVDELKKLPHVEAATTSWNVPGGETGRSFNVRRADQDSTVHLTMRHSGITMGYVDLYKIKVLAGRDFAYTDFTRGGPRHLIVNQSATKVLGYSSPEEAIGKTIIRGPQKWDIVGVIDDYHQKSLRYPLEPSMFFPAYGTNSWISVRVDPKDLSSTIDGIRKAYNNFFPGNLFDFSFLDERFNEQYKDDKLFGRVFAIFAGFAIFIACLGLLGLALFATAQRIKEIGVRKVLGASIQNIVVLLSKDFVKLVIIAFLIASPVAWYIMNNWLEGFAYRISISWWIFLSAGLLAVIIALSTISYQAIRAGMTNPVKNLRTE